MISTEYQIQCSWLLNFAEVFFSQQQKCAVNSWHRISVIFNETISKWTSNYPCNSFTCRLRYVAIILQHSLYRCAHVNVNSDHNCFTKNECVTTRCFRNKIHTLYYTPNWARANHILYSCWRHDAQCTMHIAHAVHLLFLSMKLLKL